LIAPVALVPSSPDRKRKGGRFVERVECVVVGAGAIGLSVARALALRGRETVVLEREGAFGTATSSRNSEVIHAGIYYAPGSLKARHCVAGKHMLYDYCQRMGIGHSRLGKLIVACAEDEIAVLHELKSRAGRNGVDDLRLLGRDEARALEPELECVAALLSPSTGIVDSHGLMLSLLGEIEGAGGALALRSEVTGVAAGDNGFSLTVGAGDDGFELGCRLLVNAAGLQATRLAQGFRGYDRAHVPPFHMLKGNYFSLAGRAPFSRLIYPVPVPGGAGTHITLDLGGQARFGPDTEPVDHIDYTVDPRRADSFYAAVRRYWPGLKDGTLAADYAGIRPRLGQLGDAWDFVLQGPETHGLTGLVQLYGIESPGLTACLAIGEAVADMLGA